MIMTSMRSFHQLKEKIAYLDIEDHVEDSLLERILGGWTEGQFWAETLISLNIIMTMGQETLEPVETNDIGQVKIASSAKTGKWVWVNAKQYRGILKQRLARLKWEQTRKKRSQREST
jgi:hypothetical protein